MSSNSSNGWSEDNDPPDVSDVRQFSDCILYFTKSGRYQVHGLLDDKRRVGVLTLLKGDRLSKLTMSRRLKPVLITLTPGEPPQRVFIVSLVRESKYTNLLMIHFYSTFMIVCPFLQVFPTRNWRISSHA